MKTDFRAFASILFFLLCCTSFAQTSLFVRAGGNLSEFYTPEVSYDPLLGGQAGLMADVEISEHFSVQSSLLWITKGTSGVLDPRNPLGLPHGEYRSTWRLNYLELPVAALYKAKVGKTATFFGGAGAYAGLGINGVLKTRGLYEDQKLKFSTRKIGSDNGYRRYDYGANATAGFQFERIMVVLQYNHGILENFVGENPTIVTSKNRTLGVSVAYRLGKL